MRIWDRMWDWDDDQKNAETKKTGIDSSREGTDNWGTVNITYLKRLTEEIDQKMKADKESWWSGSLYWWSSWDLSWSRHWWTPDLKYCNNHIR